VFLLPHDAYATHVHSAVSTLDWKRPPVTAGVAMGIMGMNPSLSYTEEKLLIKSNKNRHS